MDFSKTGQVFSTAVSNVESGIGSLLGGLKSAAQQAVQSATNFVQNSFGVKPSDGSLTDTNQQATDGANNTIAKALQQNPSLGTASYWNQQIKNKITILIGNYLYFDSVVITRVSQTYASNFDAQTGWPHHVRVAVAFKPLFMLAQSDLDTLFVNPTGNATSGQNSYGFSMPNVSNAFGFHL